MRHDEPRPDSQAARRPASRPVRLESNERHEKKNDAPPGNKQQATMSQMGDTIRSRYPKAIGQ